MFPTREASVDFTFSNWNLHFQLTRGAVRCIGESNTVVISTLPLSLKTEAKTCLSLLPKDLSRATIKPSERGFPKDLTNYFSTVAHVAT